jgi:hypothetical protein
VPAWVGPTSSEAAPKAWLPQVPLGCTPPYFINKTERARLMARVIFR